MGTLIGLRNNRKPPLPASPCGGRALARGLTGERHLAKKLRCRKLHQLQATGGLLASVRRVHCTGWMGEFKPPTLQSSGRVARHASGVSVLCTGVSKWFGLLLPSYRSVLE